MAEKSQLSAEAIQSELQDLRQQKRSFAMQRAEGLIDGELQRDLVADIDARITKLEHQLNNGANPKSAEESKSDTGEKSETPTAEKDDATETESESDKGDDQPADYMPEVKAETQEEEPVAEDTTDDATDDKASEESPSAEVKETEHDEPSDTETDPDKTDLVIEEEHEIRRQEDEKAIQFGKFTDEVVVSSALVKEPSYLNEVHEPNVVDIRDITKTYKMGTMELEVLKGITLQVQKGEFISIMGPSGSGKSTLMNILGALDQPTAGEYYLDSLDVSKMNEKQLAEVRNSKIGFVFQSFNLLKRTSALRQVELPLIYGTNKDRTRRAKEALEAVGLGQRLDHTPAELSGGQQQRVAIARAIVTEPSLILADEPTGNLDSRSGTEVMQIFQNMNRQNNITTIFVTHDPWIARHTDRVIMLRDGKIIADQRVKNPLVAGEAERPSEAQELQAIFDDTYYGGDEEEYT